MTQGEPPTPPPPFDPEPTPTSLPPPNTAAPLAYGGGPVQVEGNPEARQFGMFAHLSALAGFVIPLGNVIGPLVVWMMKKDQMPFVDNQGKESLNFQITVTIALVAAFVVGFVSICIGGIGFLLIPVIGIGSAIMAVMGALEANKGVAYRYPFTLRLIK